MFGIVIGKKSYDIDLNTICFALLAFIVLSAGTAWGYAFRYRACVTIIVISIINIAVNKRINGSKVTLFYFILLSLLLINCYNSYARQVSMRFFVVYLSVFMACISMDFTDFDVKLIKVIDIVTVVVAISIMVSVLNPTLFAKVFGFMLGDTSTFLTHARAGQYSGFAKEKAEAAVLMNYGIAVHIAHAFTKGIKRENIIKIGLLLVGLLLTTKRTLLVVALAIPFIFFMTAKIKLSTRLKVFVVVAILGVIGFIVVANVPALSTVLERFEELETDTTHNGREAFWAYSLMMFSEKPIWGYGYGCFNQYFNSNLGDLIIHRTWSAYGHNIYLESLGEVGAVGTVLFFSPVVIATIIGLFESRKEYDAQDRMNFYFWTYILLMNLMYGYTGNGIYYIQQIVMFTLAISRVYRLKENSFVKYGK